MADLSLYMTEDDELQIVAAAIEMGCKVIPDLYYPSPQYDSVCTLESYQRYRPRTRLFYFSSDEFYLSPLGMSQIEKSGKTIFVIMGDRGGPLICFMGGGIFVKGASEFIRPGFISHAPKYENSFRGTWERPSAKFLSIYSSLVKVAKKSATRVKYPGIRRTYWLEPGARKAVQAGARLIGFEKYSVEELLK